MRVVITLAARDNLIAIADHIALDNPSRAVSFVDEIEEACLGLAHYPERFPVVPRYADFGIRKRVFGRYLIFYRIVGDAVEVLHVLHGAAEVDPLL